MASKVEILGGTLDGSILDNAASESTLRELVDAVNRLQAASARGARGGGAGGAGGGSQTPNINTNPANQALDTLSSGVGKSGKLLNSALGGLAKGITSTAAGLTNSLMNMAGQVVNGQNNLSGFVNALSALPGPLGKFASLVGSGIATLEGYQRTQRELTMAGASFNNSMMEMRIAAAQAGMSLDDYAGFLKHHTQDIAGLGDTITDGAKKLSQVGEAVGKSGLDVEFMKLGYSAQGARQAAMKFSTELVKGDKVRGASARELAEASLSYEQDLDLLAKQTGKSKDQLREFSDSLIKRGGALQFALARLSPEVQASMKGIMNAVGETMGDGAQQVLTDMLSGAAAPSGEVGAMFQAQIPGVVETFKEMKEVGEMAATTEEEKKAKQAKLDSLMAKAQAEQLQFLQTEQGRFMMENKQRLSPAQREFITGLEKNAAALAKQGIDINTATQADIERVTAAKRAEQERQAELDKGFNAFQATITRISSAIQTTFFTILSPILERVAAGLNAMMNTFSDVGGAIEDMGIGIETITPVINYITDLLGITLGGAFQAVSFLAMKVWEGFTSLVQPIKDLFAAFGFLGTDTNGVIDAFKDLIGNVMAVVTIIKDVLGGAFDFLFTMIRMFIGAVTDIVNVFKTMFEPQIKWVSDRIRDFGNFIMNIGPEILNGIRTIFSSEGAMMIASGVKTMMQTATGKLLGGISDIIPDWAGGKKLAEISKDMLDNADASKKATVAHYDAARAQATQRDQVVQQEIENRKGQVAQTTANFKQNLETGKRELAARREREKAEAESAERRKQIQKDQEIADAMERSRQAAIKRMQELAGIKPGESQAGRAAPSGATAQQGPTAPIAMPQVPADMKSYLAATALVESGGKADAKASTSSAGGLFQFIDSTWQQMVKEMGKNYTLQDKFDPAKATEVMAYFTQKQKGQLEKGIGREASNTDLYMAHFLGAGGATKFLNAMKKDPTMSAAAMDPAAAKANKSIYYDQSGRERSLQEVYNLMGSKIGRAEQAVAANKWGGKELPAAVAALKKDISPEQLARMQTAQTPPVQAAVNQNEKQERPPVQVAVNQTEAESERLKRLAQQAAQTQTASAGPKSAPAGGTVPTSAAIAMISEQERSIQQNQQRVDQARAEQKAAEEKKLAEANKPKPEYTAPGQIDINNVLANLNTSIETLVQLQVRAVQIADQQLRATKGLNRDAFTEV